MVILGLGSNLGNRKAMLDAAITALADILTDMRCSAMLETPALLLEGSPAEWNIPFLNMAVAGECAFSPQDLLVRIKQLEQSLGRKDRGRWGPREIDIDILAMDDLVLELPELSVPHKELPNRSFALIPFAELAPDWRWPEAGEHYGKTVRELAGL